MRRRKFFSDVDGCVAGMVQGFGGFLKTEYYVDLPVERIVFHNNMGRSPGLKELDSLLRLKWPEEGADGGVGGAFKTFMKDRDVYSRWIRPLPGAVDAIARIRQDYDVVFVTAMMKSARDHYRSKMEWIERFFPDLPIMNVPSDLKHLVGESDSLAVDDRYDTVARWRAAGVNAFLFDQPWNEAPTGTLAWTWNDIVEMVCPPRNVDV